MVGSDQFYVSSEGDVIDLIAFNHYGSMVFATNVVVMERINISTKKAVRNDPHIPSWRHKVFGGVLLLPVPLPPV